MVQAGKGAVSTDASLHFGRTFDRIARSTPYKILESSQNVVPRMLALFADGKADAADDLAMVNMFQRMIDPGVSVREGDVQLQQSTQGCVVSVRVGNQACTGRCVADTGIAARYDPDCD